MLKTKVKASSITSLTDARYFSAKEVDWLGFSLDPGTDSFISPEKIHAIKEWVDGPQIVGEFGITAADEILAACEHLQLDAVQLDFLTGLDVMVELKDIPVFKEIIIEKETEVSELQRLFDFFAPFSSHFILNFIKNGIDWNSLKSGKIIDILTISHLCKAHPVYLAVDIPPASINEALEILSPEGICLFGGEEEKTGFKSFDEIDEIFENLELEETT